MFVPLSADILDNDLTLVYVASRIGLQHGWSHIYSLALQQPLFTELRPHAFFGDGQRYLSTPPYAWLLVPVGAFGPRFAVAVWLVVSLAAFGAAWSMAAPGRGPWRILWLLGALAWYPLLYSLGLAQPALVVLFLAAASWRLSEARRPYLAGLVLGLGVVKPQLTLLVPVALLAAGRWRTAAAWAVTAGGLGLLAAASLGAQGIAEYRTLLNEAQNVANNRYFTYAYLVGPGAASYVAEGAIVVVAAAAGYLNRAAGDARLFAAGIVASTLGATYWHLQDFTILVLAAWLFCRDATPAWQRWWLLATAVAGEFAWGFTPLPILAGVTLWLVFLVLPGRPAVRPEPAVATAG